MRASVIQKTRKVRTRKLMGVKHTHTRTHRNAMIGEVMAFWAQLRDPACGMPIAP